MVGVVNEASVEPNSLLALGVYGRRGLDANWGDMFSFL
jgi:hypothetical protein